MLFGIPTRLETLLGLVAGQVAAGTNISSTYVYPTLADDDEISLRPTCEKFVTINPQSFPVRLGEQTGGSTTTLGFDGRWKVSLFARLETDVAGRDADFLIDQANGVLVTWRYLLASLEQYKPLDGSGNCLLIQPMRISNFDIKPRKRKGGWGRLDSFWEVSFVYDLSGSLS